MKITGMAFIFVGIIWMVASLFIKSDTEAKKSDSLIMLVGGTAIFGIGILIANK